MYNDTLYEDSWDDNAIKQFEDALYAYDKNVKLLDEIIPKIEWSDEKAKQSFMETYQNVLKDDLELYQLSKLRHDLYLTYRTNRKSLISHLNDVIGIVRNKVGKQYTEVLEYFNDECAKVPLYKHNGSYLHKSMVLNNWFNKQGQTVTEKINDSLRISSKYQVSECYDVFRGYVKLRYAVFSIFNMITSNNRINGYNKWKNIVESYCSNTLKDIQLRTLYQSLGAELDFVKNDTFYQELDDRSWNMQGLYESWLDDLYKKPIILTQHSNINKKDIVKIDMKHDKSNQCRILCDGKWVYAACKFYPNDIIEVCPCRTVDRMSMFAKDIRDIIFETKKNEEWVIPFGYCQYYDIDESGDDSNCSFKWDPIARTIIILATRPIEKHEKLILKNVN